MTLDMGDLKLFSLVAMFWERLRRGGHGAQREAPPGEVLCIHRMLCMDAWSRAP